MLKSVIFLRISLLECRSVPLVPGIQGVHVRFPGEDRRHVDCSTSKGSGWWRFRLPGRGVQDHRRRRHGFPVINPHSQASSRTAKVVGWGERLHREPQHYNVGVHGKAVHPNLQVKTKNSICDRAKHICGRNAFSVLPSTISDIFTTVPPSAPCARAHQDCTLLTIRPNPKCRPIAP